ncbi:hypothetical protein ACFL1H_05725 [Nanoarchaeota archaeon]
MDKIKLVAYGLCLSGIGIAYVAAEYGDLPGWTDYAKGREKNSIATVTTGIIARELCDQSTFDIRVKKKFWGDPRVIGETKNNYIKAKTKVMLTGATFEVKEEDFGPNSYIKKGRVAKSEIDWEVKQIGPNKYDIGRWAVKFDKTLILNVEDGKIDGKFVRPGLAFDWKIKGTYDRDNNIDVYIDGWFNMGIGLEGKIECQ